MTAFDRIRIAAEAGASIALSNALWYACVAGGVWVIFYWLFRSFFRRRRISSGDFVRSQVVREFLHSLRSLAIFGIMGAVVVWCAMLGWTRVYGRIERHGWIWFVASIGLMILIHDTNFYWTHRLMHHRRLYRPIHHTHHLSTSPTPWAAYAFSPLEAFVQAGIAPVILFTLPVHPLAFSIFMAWQITFIVFGHCGYEIFPNWFLRSPLGKFLNSPTHHALHHEKYLANFSLYFNVWDRLMGTNHPAYEERFEQATTPTST